MRTNLFKYLKEQARNIVFEMSQYPRTTEEDMVYEDKSPTSANELLSMIVPKLEQQSINKQMIKEKFEKERDPLLRFKPGQIVCDSSGDERAFYKILRNSYSLRHDGPDYDYVAVKVTPFSQSLEEELLYDDLLQSYSEAIDERVKNLEEERQDLLKAFDKFSELEKTFLQSGK